MSSPASSRFPRVNSQTVTNYKNWTIPVNVPVSMNIWNTHFNADIFPDPYEYKPERWLQAGSKDLEKYLVPFGSGSRMCIGMNLSLAEQYLGLAYVFRRYKLELFETKKSDVMMHASCMITLSNPNSPGVRVTVEKMQA